MLESQDAGNLDTVRAETTDAIQSAATEETPVLVEAPPVSGKTTSAFELASNDGEPITYLAGRTDLYDQAKRWCRDEDDVTWAIIPSPHRDCPTFQYGTDGNARAVRRLYAKGMSGRAIHFASEAYTPCASDCEYLEMLDRIDEGVDDIDLLIGHHSHLRRHQYVRNRIVVIDEFNPDPFKDRFPSDGDISVIDEPGTLVQVYLDAIHDRAEGSPLDEIDDVTDIIRRRDEAGFRNSVLDWLNEQGITRSAAEDIEFFTPTSYRYDEHHLSAPLLLFSLFSMEKIGPGLELAPAAEESIRDHWSDSDLGAGVRCLRDRNSGTMHLLKPPDFSAASQVIGLDGTPTLDLWNLLLAPENGFEHRQVISRDDYMTYLRSALSMSLVQIGKGMHNYAGGQVSDYDRHRFSAVRAREGERFPLVSTKQALNRFEANGLIEKFVREWDRNDPDGDSPFATRNYHSILSSNVFGDEQLGAVIGSPFPNDEVVRIWAAFGGEVVESEGRGEEKTFGEYGDQIFQHFAHKQVAQAAMRFGRSESAIESGGATVYVSTKALPDWFRPETVIENRWNEKEYAIIMAVRSETSVGDSGSITVQELADVVDDRLEGSDSVSNEYTRNVLEDLVTRDVVGVSRSTSDADAYQWNGEDCLHDIEGSPPMLLTDDRMYGLRSEI